ncbi:putative tetratricopeptide repeat-containing domain, acetyltransferase A, auxiliary subunit [Lupinus albus]|uniref:Putative tetratricopeptide repeat-containing domain, acetyltransferase A, auxiliary subunit n=1 Tax=Lupinus albus TaxID=3870 RepID=A0A6A4PW15_LUPAL|nr:putative tetratricopeptide repeat-containing domain, acetyltransferase A, auxiliary subunit [Lupinus albus]
MSHIATDSPLSRRIVRSFLHFLNSVEPGSGVDVEGIDVAKECLAEAFKLNNHETGDHANPDSLIDLFKSLDTNKQCETIKPDIAHPQQPHSVDAAAASSSSFSPQNPAQTPYHSMAAKSLDEDSIWRRRIIESKDELGVQFFAALEKIDYFRTNADGIDDPLQLEKASCLLNDALMDMEKSGCPEFSVKNLAESLKSLGNKAMQSKQYLGAIELYNCAIALYEKSAVYYCNRAAAYTQIDRYTEAIQDCLKSIEIDPYYSKAFSRLGLAYYAQGNYQDAIDEGFDKALLLDPTNESVRENIQVARTKLIEQYARQFQSSTARSNATSNPTSATFGMSNPTSATFGMSNPTSASFGMSNPTSASFGMSNPTSATSGTSSSFTFTGDDIPAIFRNMTSNFVHPRES